MNGGILARLATPMILSLSAYRVCEVVQAKILSRSMAEDMLSDPLQRFSYQLEGVVSGISVEVWVSDVGSRVLSVQSLGFRFPEAMLARHTFVSGVGATWYSIPMAMSTSQN